MEQLLKWSVFWFCSFHWNSADLLEFPASKYEYDVSTAQNDAWTELSTRLITDGSKLRLEKRLSPYVVRDDLFIDEGAVLTIEPGVVLLFAPMVGVTVRGVLLAGGNENERIKFSSLAYEKNETSQSITGSVIREDQWPSVRLVDGPNILAGRLQLLYNNRWRSVCTNSRNWTRSDLETICRQMGFQGGKWWNWMNSRSTVTKTDSRMLLEKPGCRGTESAITECPGWNSHDRQLGSGVCDYHPDIGVSCTGQHDTGSVKRHLSGHWRGIYFKNSESENTLIHQNSLYISKSKSNLNFVDISFAGSGRDYDAWSAVTSFGSAPPNLVSVSITESAYNGLNVTQPDAPFTIHNSTFSNNRGCGIFVNSSTGGVWLDNCWMEENGGDGVRYVQHDLAPNSVTIRTKDPIGTHSTHLQQPLLDFCTFPTTSSQTFPISVSFEKKFYLQSDKQCNKNFFTRNGHVMSVLFEDLRHWTWSPDWWSGYGSPNTAFYSGPESNAKIEIYDGISSNDNLLASVPIRNLTKPQSISTTSNNMYISIVAPARSQVYGVLKIISSPSKWYDLRMTESTVSNNNGHGILVENMRNQLSMSKSSVSNNRFSGVQVLAGTGFINISECRIAFNDGDGLNISFAGGSTNVSYSFLSSNSGHAVSIYSNFSFTSETAFLRPDLSLADNDYYAQYKFRSTFVPQSRQQTVFAYNEIFKNLETGILVGNFCSSNSFVNVTGNRFNNSFGDCIQVHSCLRTGSTMKLQIGNNYFFGNRRLGVKLTPLLNSEVIIEHNHFTRNTFGCILVKNERHLSSQDRLLESSAPVKITIKNNQFYENTGQYVANLGLTAYSHVQRLLFTWNFVRDNELHERPVVAAGTGSRSRAPAALVISSENVQIFRNILQNRNSEYEIASHLQDQSLVLNCTFNWLGYDKEEKIFYRLFHRKDRYNLARIEFIPFLLHSSNPAAGTVMPFSSYVPQFVTEGNKVGGELDGQEFLRGPAQYIVERDISIRPGGSLTLQPGVVLKFPVGVGMIVAGKLEARGQSNHEIRFTLNQAFGSNEAITDNLVNNDPQQTNSSSVPADDGEPPVRLYGGKNQMEGRLQVLIEGKWGTVCDYGWTVQAAALVCHQLGFILNPDNWRLEPNLVGSTNEYPILLSNVKCSEEDLELAECHWEKARQDFENSCNREQEVAMRCDKPKWAGLRMAVLAESTTLKYLTIDQAGLFDYSTNQLSSALQIDLNRHRLEYVRLVDNLQDGLRIIYSDMYHPWHASGSSTGENSINNCEFSNNQRFGLSVKQFALKVSYGLITNNGAAGVRHDPILSEKQQQELLGWFRDATLVANAAGMLMDDEGEAAMAARSPVFVPGSNQLVDIYLREAGSKLFISDITTSAFLTLPINRTYHVRTVAGYCLGIQLYGRIRNESTERIWLYEGDDISPPASGSTSSEFVGILDVKRDLSAFPTRTWSNRLTLYYESGTQPTGNVVLLITSVPVRRMPRALHHLNYDVVPTLLLSNTRIRGNGRAIWTKHYNQYLSERGDLYLRKNNVSLCILDSELTNNENEAILVHSVPSDQLVNFTTLQQGRSNLSEISFVVNNTIIANNGRGAVRQTSRDERDSTNLFHWYLHGNRIETNEAGGIRIQLPYVWTYNENHTHSISLHNNSIARNNRFSASLDGHYAKLNITGNLFERNLCKDGVLSIGGMEKSMMIAQNRIEKNIGNFVVQFRLDSQSEIRGQLAAHFFENYLVDNDPISPQIGSSVIVFDGIQKVRVERNVMNGNKMAYLLVAGVRTAQLASTLDVTENWWGTTDQQTIKRQIFDFDDWNDHAVANYRPYLIDDTFDAAVSVSSDAGVTVDENNLSGRLTNSLRLVGRSEPYLINSDLTVMPGVTLTIEPGAILQFSSRIGMLILGTLLARGEPDKPIIFQPVPSDHQDHLIPPAALQNRTKSGSRWLLDGVSLEIRLCEGASCASAETKQRQGFLEYWNRTTLRWVPVCERTFTPQNARVACRQLGLPSTNVWLGRARRYEFAAHSLSRVSWWPEPLQCAGDEEMLSDCRIRVSEELLHRERSCAWDGDFVFVRCGISPESDDDKHFWGGIRFTKSEFEWNNFEERIHDAVTHQTGGNADRQSILEYVRVEGAGLLHYDLSSAVLAVGQSPRITRSNITSSAFHGITFLCPDSHLALLFNRLEENGGVGITVGTLTGEGRENDRSSFSAVSILDIPDKLFGLLNMCDPLKEMIVQERILVYYKYANAPVSCIKIFHSAFRKPFGIRFMQLNLFNETDAIWIYDGSVYNVTAPLLATITVPASDSPEPERRFIVGNWSSLSLKMMASGAGGEYGFVAEIVTLPIAAIGFNRDVLHNISDSVFRKNWLGAVKYVSAGEVNPRLTLESNQFVENCAHLYGNFSSCSPHAAITFDLQNTQTLIFRNNLVMKNFGGGMWVKSDSEGSATSLKAVLERNLFTENEVGCALLVEGRRSSPYQDVVIHRNFFATNKCPYNNVIELDQVMSNFSMNFVQSNIGSHTLYVSGFERVRLPIFQTNSHNGFYWNVALQRDGKSTIVAGTAGQHYIDNVFLDPDNDYEILTINASSLEGWKTPIDARHNYWGFNESAAVAGRIRDADDDVRLLKVNYIPYHGTNSSILDAKCPPSWNLVIDTCYIFIGAPMSFHQARQFCSSVNASMPYVVANSLTIYKFLMIQNPDYMFYDRVWMQSLDHINQCTSFAFQTIELDDCNHLHPFVCEIDPKVVINVLSWRGDVLTIAVFGGLGTMLLLLLVVLVLCYYKSKHRQVERLQRRNSIRQSLNSLRSLSSSQTQVATSEFAAALRRKPFATSTAEENLISNADSPTSFSRSSTLEYKKLNGLGMSGGAGSVDSMEKSQFNSSLEDDDGRSYDIYEAHNPNTAPSTRHKSANTALSYQNQGYRGNSSSTFVGDTDTWGSNDYYTMKCIDSATLPSKVALRLQPKSSPTSTVTTTSSFFRPTSVNYQLENEYQQYYDAPTKSKFDVPGLPVVAPPPARSKSEMLLETNFEYKPPIPAAEVPVTGRRNVPPPIAPLRPSKSQPLETAM